MSSLQLDESIRSQAHRILKALANFRPGAQPDLPADVRAQIMPDEDLLGIYANSDTDVTANLVFTTRGIYHFADGWTCLAYANIASVDVERGGNFRRFLADTLIFRSRNGQLLPLRISGAKTRPVLGAHSDLRFPDIYEMLRFLRRVLERVNDERYR